MLHDNSMILTAVWLCLITHVAYGTIITVNNNGDNSSSCCVYGRWPCSSLSSALNNVSDNTVINITSESVTLHDVGMGSGNLSNITITGNGATIMCNNTGGVHCESCSNITIMGITWYQCGRSNPDYPAINTPVLNFTTGSDIIIRNCTFQSSSGCPVYVKNAREHITIQDSNFNSNIFDASEYLHGCAGLFVDSENGSLSITITSSKFYSSGCKSSTIKQCSHYGILILGCTNYCEQVNLLIEGTEFLNNYYGLYLHGENAKTTMVYLSHVNFSDNIAYGALILTPVLNNSTIIVNISFVTFMNNINAFGIVGPLAAREINATIKISNSTFNDNRANDDDAHYSHSKQLGVLRVALMSSNASVTIENCYFYNNFNGAVGIHVAPYKTECIPVGVWITFTNVNIYNTTTIHNIAYASIASVSIVTVNILTVVITFTNVNFTSNNYSRHDGEVLLIENSEECDHYRSYVSTVLKNCTFDSNAATDHMVFLHIKTDVSDGYRDFYDIQLSRCNFDNNFGGKSIVYVVGPTSISRSTDSRLTLDNSTFSSNTGTALRSNIAYCLFLKMVFFINNTANSGAAIYFEEVHSMQSDNNSDIHFINNTAVQKGGALYFNLVTDYCDVFSKPFNASFSDNSAKVAGNSIYFSIPQTCQVNTNTSDNSSLLYIPDKFTYFQQLHSKGPPTVTSPHSFKLYPPAVAINNSSNDYLIQQPKMLGEPIQFIASVFDYFNNITEPVIFSIDCSSCGDDYVLSTYQITVHNELLHEFKVYPTASNDVTSSINISLTMLSILPPVYKSLSASLSIELSSCHTGYLFDESQRQCICYPYSDIVHCNEQYVEIKIGYWIGFLTKQHYTSSVCPSYYCNFANCTETSPGYYSLHGKSDDQCSSHRTGVACGECKSGYTLAYDSPDCINTDRCSAGMTILVIVLTILYWIAIVAVVFGLMYFQFQISSGYAYGIIYYYSIVDILLGNNISEEVFQFVAVFSSFAKLTPQLFGQLCLVKGLSGIDQLFIHYSHALAISLILLIIVMVTRYSPRFAVFVRRCIICIICLLLLLSYTSLASTSLQLLRPLTFNDVDEVRTYSSPDIEYFTGRHLVYGIVAILCEVIIVIGLPLFLLLEPILGRRFNFVKIKPLLDQFQGCYKDKYRYFAVYYLLCRQVIILIVYVGNEDYYNKLYYLQTACIIIAMIHGWVQPYKKKLVNGLDEAILLTLVLVVNLNTFSFLSSISSQLSVVLIILPLLLLSLIGIRKLIIRCYNKKKKSFYLYNPVDVNVEFEEDEDDDNDNNEANDIRFVAA